MILSIHFLGLTISVIILVLHLPRSVFGTTSLQTSGQTEIGKQNKQVPSWAGQVTGLTIVSSRVLYDCIVIA